MKINGTANLEVIAHSISDPSINFSIGEDIEYLGDYYRVSEEDNELNILTELLSDGMGFLIRNNGMILTIFVVGLGAVLLNRALIKRKEDMEKIRLNLKLNQKKR